MLILRSEEIALSRPVRMLHPRRPVYIVPRGEGLFMVGATMIENEERARVTARSVVELVNSAFAIHPAFAEAEIVETGSDVRPAFPDNLPRIRSGAARSISTGSTATAFCSRRRWRAARLRSFCTTGIFPEVMDADSGQRAAARGRARPRCERCCDELGYDEQTVGTAVNQEFVRARDRGRDAACSEGDAVEIVTPRQGG